jgi:hypothetical protein
MCQGRGARSGWRGHRGARWSPKRLLTHVVGDGGHRRERAAGASGPGIAQRLAPAGDAGEQHCVARISVLNFGRIRAKRRLWECGSDGQDQKPPTAVAKGTGTLAPTEPIFELGAHPCLTPLMIGREDERGTMVWAAGEGGKGNLQAAGTGRAGGRAGGRTATIGRRQHSFRSGGGNGLAGAGNSAATLGTGAPDCNADALMTPACSVVSANASRAPRGRRTHLRAVQGSFSASISRADAQRPASLPAARRGRRRAGRAPPVERGDAGSAWSGAPSVGWAEHRPARRHITPDAHLQKCNRKNAPKAVNVCGGW